MSANSSAIKRIQRDILEWRESARHFPNIGAEPLEDNLYIWHFNIVVGEEIALHGRVKFPKNYPFAPPQVHFFGDVPHRQVSMGHNGSLAPLCLDVLQETNHGFYSGWSSSYSIVSIFAQIETLLHRLGKNQVTEYWPTFGCRVCGHDGTDVDSFIPQPFFEAPVGGLSDEDMKQSDIPVWRMLNADVESVIFGFLSQTDLRMMVHVSCSIRNVLYNLRLYHYRSVECYHSKNNFGDFCELLKRIVASSSSGAAAADDDDDDSDSDSDDEDDDDDEDDLASAIEKALFGIGFNTDYWNNSNRQTGKVENVLKDLYVSTDVLSYGAFQEGVHFSMWRDFRFEKFIPIYLNNAHGKTAMSLAETVIKECYQIPSNKHFEPVLALKFLSKLMNTTVVSLMNEVSKDDSESVHLFTSMKALQTYMYFYHLLLGFAKKYYSIVKHARKKIQQFVTEPNRRDKKNYPDLGEFLIYLAIAPVYSWSEFGPVFEEEAMTRNAKWILKEHPSLISVEKNDGLSCVRLRRSWETSQVGKRLQMFQYYFLHHICGVGRGRGAGSDGGLNLNGRLKLLNSCLGQVEESVAVGLQRRCRVIFQVRDWLEFYELINLPCPTALKLSHEMRLAMLESDRKGYHRFVETRVGDSEPHEDPSLCLCSGRIMSTKMQSRRRGRRGGRKAPETKEVEEEDGDDDDDVKDRDNDEVGCRYLDVAFCLDCTGSMSGMLRTAQENMKNIARELNKNGKIDVRFAVVGYRNHHEDERGGWPRVTKVHNFCKLKPFETGLATYTAGCGGGPFEAVACGWNDVNQLDWRRFAVKAVIQIADIGCQGQVSERNACPHGYDAIQLAREMLEQDITMYCVGTTPHMDPYSEDFFRGTAHMTGGSYLTLENTSQLPRVIVESTREGISLSAVVPMVGKLLKKYRRQNRHATKDQLAYLVWNELVEQNVSTRKVSCVKADATSLNSRVLKLSEADSMADCRRIMKGSRTMPKHAKKRGGRSGLTKQGQENLKSNDKLITLEQVLRCMNRAEQVADQSEWEERGCVYRLEKYQPKCAKERFAACEVTFSNRIKKIQLQAFRMNQIVDFRDPKTGELFLTRVSRVDDAAFCVTLRDVQNGRTFKCIKGSLNMTPSTRTVPVEMENKRGPGGGGRSNQYAQRPNFQSRRRRPGPPRPPRTANRRRQQPSKKESRPQKRKVKRPRVAENVRISWSASDIVTPSAEKSQKDLLKEKLNLTIDNADRNGLLSALESVSPYRARQECCTPDERTGKTLLHAASLCRNVLVVNTLMEFGADPAQRDSDGNTPFECLRNYVASRQMTNDELQNHQFVARRLLEAISHPQTRNCRAGIWDAEPSPPLPPPSDAVEEQKARPEMTTTTTTTMTRKEKNKTVTTSGATTTTRLAGPVVPPMVMNRQRKRDLIGLVSVSNLPWTVSESDVLELAFGMRLPVIGGQVVLIPISATMLRAEIPIDISNLTDALYSVVCLNTCTYHNVPLQASVDFMDSRAVQVRLAAAVQNNKVEAAEEKKAVEEPAMRAAVVTPKKRSPPPMSMASPPRRPARRPAMQVFSHLRQSDLVVKSALCVIPPRSLWDPIQAIRKVYDKSYRRWMPHINMLYPYVEAASFGEHVGPIEEAFRLENMKSFRVEFCGFDYFDRRSSDADPDPKLYVYLKTRVVRGNKRSWDLLMGVLKKMYPNGVKRQAFKPHLTVGQMERSRVKKFVADLNSKFTRATFDVDGVALISRRGFSTPFVVDHVVQF